MNPVFSKCLIRGQLENEAMGSFEITKGTTDVNPPQEEHFFTK
jgi:hypothetical protein